MLKALLKVMVAYGESWRFSADNDNSAMLKLGYGKASFLFTGDCGLKCEDKLMEKKGISADILKVSHHGSKHSTSNEFLKKVKPKLAVISVGKNSYGHPANETLERLNAAGIDILRTDLDGAVVITTDGESYSLI